MAVSAEFAGKPAAEWFLNNVGCIRVSNMKISLPFGFLRLLSMSVWLTASAVTAVVASTPAENVKTVARPKIAEGPFEPTVASLIKHQTPDWFRDAKFGIYTHWGPVAVATARMPAGQSDCWYGRYMYCPGLSGPLAPGRIPSRATFEFHRRVFGDRSSGAAYDVFGWHRGNRQFR